MPAFVRVVRRDEISACWVKGEPFLSIKRGPSSNPLFQSEFAGAEKGEKPKATSCPRSLFP